MNITYVLYVLLILLIVIVICISCIHLTKLFMKDSKHDLEIIFGKFRFVIKKYNEE